MKPIAVAFLLLFVVNWTGCATSTKLTPKQQAYLDEAMAMPLEFNMPKSEADAAWQRAQSFINRFSSMKLQKLSGNVIRTYSPTQLSTPFGYYIRKIPLGEDVRFAVQCLCSTLSAREESLQNAHILAYYMKTGKLDASLVVQ